MKCLQHFEALEFILSTSQLSWRNICCPCIRTNATLHLNNFQTNKIVGNTTGKKHKHYIRLSASGVIVYLCAEKNL